MPRSSPPGPPHEDRPSSYPYPSGSSSDTLRSTVSEPQTAILSPAPARIDDGSLRPSRASINASTPSPWHTEFVPRPRPASTLGRMVLAGRGAGDFEVEDVAAAFARRKKARDWVTLDSRGVRPRVRARLGPVYIATHVLVVTVLLGLGLGWIAYNIQRLVTAQPVLESSSKIVQTLAIPPMVICGESLSSIECESSRWDAMANETFTCPVPVSRYGFGSGSPGQKPLTVGDFPQNSLFNASWPCFYFSPPANFSFNTQNVQRVTLVINSKEKTTIGSNATKSGGISFTSPRWLLVGKPVFQDPPPSPLRFDFEWLFAPTIGNVIFQRTELSKIRGSQVSLSWRLLSQQLYDGFEGDPNLWAILRIHPELSSTEVKNAPPGFSSPLTNETQSLTVGYTVQVLSEAFSFTLPNFIASFGGVLTGSITIYVILYGAAKVNPWGLMQRFVFRTAPFRKRDPKAETRRDEMRERLKADPFPKFDGTPAFELTSHTTVPSLPRQLTPTGTPPPPSRRGRSAGRDYEDAASDAESSATRGGASKGRMSEVLRAVMVDVNALYQRVGSLEQDGGARSGRLEALERLLSAYYVADLLELDYGTTDNLHTV